MKNVITIARQFACGGRHIGKLVADMLNVKYYDRELINMAAKLKGANEEFYEKYDEKASTIFNNMFSFTGSVASFYSPVTASYVINDDLFFTQVEIIKKISEEPCVIVGRCADYILREKENVVSVFLYADMQTRKQQLIERYHPSDVDKIEKVLSKADKQRSNYYETYTGRKWDNPRNYHIAINTGKISQEQVAKIIVDYAKNY